MRKFTLLLAMIALVSVAFGQKGFLPMTARLTEAENVTTNPKAVVKQKTKSRSTILWSEDFSGDKWAETSQDEKPLPANAPEDWELTDETGSGYFWRWSKKGPRGRFTSKKNGDPNDYCLKHREPLNSETSYNGFMILESDFYNTPEDCKGYFGKGMDASITYSKGIDFSASTAVHFLITQWHRFCCIYDSENNAVLETSTDGGVTWDQISITDAGVNSYTTNGAQCEYDITSMVAGKENVQFRIRQFGLSHYMWLLDDIAFVEPAEYDVRILDYWNDYIYVYDGYKIEEGKPFHYYSTKDFIEGFYAYPWFMVQDFKAYAAEFNNFGLKEVTNYKQGVQILKNNVVVKTIEDEEAIATVNPGLTDTTKVLVDYTPDGKGYYEIIHYPIMNEDDGDTDNDTVKRPFTITDNILSPVNHKVYDGRVSPDGWTSYEPGYGFGFQFTFPDASLHGSNGDFYTVKGVEVFVSPQYYEGAAELFTNKKAGFKAELYRYNEDEKKYVKVITSELRELSDDDTASIVNIPFQYDGSTENIEASGNYLVNLVFVGNWEDDLGRTESFSIYSNESLKNSYDGASLVSPNAEKVGSVGAGPCIALDIDYNQDYATAESEVNVYVSDGTTPIEGATVMLGSSLVKTNSDGQASIKIEDGTYPIKVSAEGYQDFSMPITVPTTGTVEIELTKIYEVEFTVEDDLGVIGFAEISFASQDIKSKRTNANGKAVFNLLGGTYSYTVKRIGHTDYSKELSVTDNAEESVIMERTAFDVTFIVKDNNDATLEGAQIKIEDETVTTDSEGKATIASSFGIIEYTVTKDGYTSESKVLTVDKDDIEVNVKLSKTYKATFTVKNNSNELLKDAEVTIGEESINTDNNGVAVFELIPGDYDYVVVKTPYGNVEGTITITTGDITEDVQMIQVFNAKFVVTADDAPAANATITINSEEYKTNVQGIADVKLPKGTYNYVAKYDGYNDLSGSIKIEDSDIEEEVAFVGISDVFATFEVYPNPCNGSFTVNVDGVANMTIVDIAGQIVDSRIINGSETVNLDVANGVYFIHVQNGNENATKPVVIK